MTNKTNWSFFFQNSHKRTSENVKKHDLININYKISLQAFEQNTIHILLKKKYKIKYYDIITESQGKNKRTSKRTKSELGCLYACPFFKIFLYNITKMMSFGFTNYKLFLIMLEPKVINLCHQYKSQASLHTMDSFKTWRWIVPFKK